MARDCHKHIVIFLAVFSSAACIVFANSFEDLDERTSLNSSIAKFIRGNRKLSDEDINARSYDCNGKPDGNYPDYDQCSGYFYMCTNGYDKYFACALQGTVFDPTLDRCEYCQLVSPCNADPNNIRCPDGGVGPSCPPTIPPGYICVCGATSCNLELIRPTCPPYDPNVYICVCGATSCNLQLISTTTARPTCPPYDPNVYICVCGATSCNLELIRPTCPPYDPNVYICVCGATSCNLQLISTTTARPTCPPYDPNVYICVCGANSCNLELIRPTCPPYDPNVYICICGVSSCQLQLITTTTPAPPTCPPFDPNVYICICGVSSCQLQLISTTTSRPTCPPYDPNVYICVCGATSCNLELIRPTCPPYDPNVYVCICGVSSCSLQLITTTSRPTGGVTAACPGRTVGTTPGDYQYNCSGKPDGNYEDPFDFCSGGFYMCTNGVAKYFICALQGTVFDPRQDRCDYCYNVPPCNSFPNLE